MCVLVCPGHMEREVYNKYFIVYSLKSLIASLLLLQVLVETIR